MIERRSVKFSENPKSLAALAEEAAGSTGCPKCGCRRIRERDGKHICWLCGRKVAPPKPV